MDHAQRRRLIERFFDEAHVSMWACDEEYRIVLWNSGAAEVYGRRTPDMIGRDFANEFVDEVERDDARADCDKIIQFGERYRNFIAWDMPPSGRRRVMLTNCYRIVDPETGERFQAEVGVEISELHVAEEHHRTLRELGVKRQTERRLQFERELQDAQLRAERIKDEVRYLCERYLQEIEVYRRTATDRTRVIVEESAELQRSDALALRAVLIDELDGLRQELASKRTSEELDTIRQRLANPEHWTGRFRELDIPR